MANANDGTENVKTFNLKEHEAAKAKEKAVAAKAKITPPAQPKRHKNYKGGKNISGTILNGWRQRAKRDGIAFNITLDEVDKMWDKQYGRCQVTGRQLTTTKNDPNKVSLDRVESSGIYELANVRLVTTAVNYAKHTMTDNDLRKLLEDMSYIDRLRTKYQKRPTGGSWYTLVMRAEYERIFGRQEPDDL